MAPAKRTTVYLDPKLHRALRITAAATDQTISELVNEAVRFRLAEDADDFQAFGARAKEPSLSFKMTTRKPKPSASRRRQSSSRTRRR